MSTAGRTGAKTAETTAATGVDAPGPVTAATPVQISRGRAPAAAGGPAFPVTLSGDAPPALPVLAEPPVVFPCRGECPKDRFTVTPDGEPSVNDLCADYRSGERSLR